MLTREDWTQGTGTSAAVKGLIWFTDESKMKEVNRAGVYGQSVGRRLSFSLGGYATVFEAEIYAVLVCVYKIQLQNRSEKYVSVCSDSQADLKALQAIRTTSALVQQCQKALNDVPTQHAVRLHWVSGHARIQGNEIADGLARGGTVLRFLGPEPALGVSRRDIQKRLSRWLVNQHSARLRGLSDTQRQARVLILGPRLGAKAKFLFFNRTQSRVLIGLLTVHKTLRRHLNLLGLLDRPSCWRCGVKEETLANILCECETLASLRHAYLGYFFLEPEDINNISLGVIWNFSKVTGLP
jgi:ribonuclease HI